MAYDFSLPGCAAGARAPDLGLPRREQAKLLVDEWKGPRIEGFERVVEFSEPRVVRTGEVRIHAGTMRGTPALVIGHMLHSHRFVPSAARAAQLGRRIRAAWSQWR